MRRGKRQSEGTPREMQRTWRAASWPQLLDSTGGREEWWLLLSGINGCPELTRSTGRPVGTEILVVWRRLPVERMSTTGERS